MWVAIREDKAVTAGSLDIGKNKGHSFLGNCFFNSTIHRKLTSYIRRKAPSVVNVIK